VVTAYILVRVQQPRWMAVVYRNSVDTNANVWAEIQWLEGQ